MNNTPQFSICLPAYNRPEYLRETINSILKQNYKNFEIIISDDASPIDLTDTVKSYSDKRIRFYRQEKNLGFIKNWNFCIKQSKGKFIKIMGDDDIINENCLKTELKLLEEQKIKILISQFKTINSKGELFKTPDCFKQPNKTTTFSNLEFSKLYFFGKSYFGLPTAVTFDKELLEKTGLFDDTIGCPADIDMWLRMSAVTPIYYTQEILSYMRWHENNLSKQLAKNSFNYKEDLKTLEKNYPNVSKQLTLKEKIKIYNRYERKILGRIKDNLDNFKYIIQYSKDSFSLLKIIFFQEKR